MTALRLAVPVTLEASTAMHEVARVLRQENSGYALLTEGERLAGILTERDFLTKVLDVAGTLDRPASEFMTPDPVTVRHDDPVHKAAYHMHHGGFRSMPVLDETGRVAGCVRHRDLIRFLVDHLAEHALNLPPDPDQVAQTPEGG